MRKVLVVASVSRDERDVGVAHPSDRDRRARRPPWGLDGDLVGVVEERVEARSAKDADLGARQGHQAALEPEDFEPEDFEPEDFGPEELGPDDFASDFVEVDDEPESELDPDFESLVVDDELEELDESLLVPELDDLSEAVLRDFDRERAESDESVL